MNQTRVNSSICLHTVIPPNPHSHTFFFDQFRSPRFMYELKRFEISIRTHCCNCCSTPRYTPVIQTVGLMISLVLYQILDSASLHFLCVTLYALVKRLDFFHPIFLTHRLLSLSRIPPGSPRHTHTSRSFPSPKGHPLFPYTSSQNLHTIQQKYPPPHFFIDLHLALSLSFSVRSRSCSFAARLISRRSVLQLLLLLQCWI